MAGTGLSGTPEGVGGRPCSSPESLESESESDPESDESEELDALDEEESESLLVSGSGAETSCPKMSLGETGALAGASSAESVTFVLVSGTPEGAGGPVADVDAEAPLCRLRRLLRE